ncbi:12061_t:CDS:2, partial [Racocetra persica]
KRGVGGQKHKDEQIILATPVVDYRKFAVLEDKEPTAKLT